jgi:hypothetical protein
MFSEVSEITFLRPDAIKEAFKDLSLAEVPLIGVVQMENSRFAYQQR